MSAPAALSLLIERAANALHVLSAYAHELDPEQHARLDEAVTAFCDAVMAERGFTRVEDLAELFTDGDWRPSK